MSHPVILFDGECAFCDGTVNWIIDRDPDTWFRFASLQSETGQKLAKQHNVDLEQTDSLVVLSNGVGHLYSSAALAIARELHWPWRLLAVFWIVPAPVRDGAYRIFARHRYRWFGRLDSCRIPTPDVRARFLE